MDSIIKGALIIATAIVISAIYYSYNSDYKSCVREYKQAIEANEVGGDEVDANRWCLPIGTSLR